MARPDADGNPSIARHLRNLGYVPTEYQGEGRVWEDPDELGYVYADKPPTVKHMSGDMLLRVCDDIIPEHEQAEITQAALLCHREKHAEAEDNRRAAGYDGL